jgi:hypothetical protein
MLPLRAVDSNVGRSMDKTWVFPTIIDQCYGQRGMHVWRGYADTEQPLNSIVFEPFWKSSSLEVGLTEEAESSYAAGEYHDLGSLNAHFRVKSVQ